MSRYSKTCPACGHVFGAHEVKLGGRSFPCPQCTKELEYAFQHLKTISLITLLICASIPIILGIRGLRAIGTALVAFPFVWIVCKLVDDQIHPPSVKLRFE
jgi:hypothetical protein